MKAITISQKKITYGDVSFQSYRNGVAVSVAYCGLCGSDVQRIDNLIKSGDKHPVLGHEIIGNINSIPDGVKTNFRIGDFVVISPILSCNKCEYCKRGNIQFCNENKSIGKTLDGGFSEKVCVPIKNLYKIPKNKICKDLVLADPLSVCLHALSKIRGIKNKNIAIIGGGAIGEIMSRLAIYKKAKKICIVHKKNISKKKKGIIEYVNTVNI
ncbi:MAG: alcohol dehydrogenase catalytic domain-containing protein, partial [bacterium]